jgi:hypothetical protein
VISQAEVLVVLKARRARRVADVRSNTTGKARKSCLPPSLRASGVLA